MKSVECTKLGLLASAAVAVRATEHREQGPWLLLCSGYCLCNCDWSLDWWKSQSNCLNSETLGVFHQLLTATDSSAGAERVFSSIIGLVHSKFCNRLGIEKAGKLVFFLTYEQ